MNNKQSIISKMLIVVLTLQGVMSNNRVSTKSNTVVQTGSNKAEVKTTSTTTTTNNQTSTN